jgi:hypothetical protein
MGGAVREPDDFDRVALTRAAARPDTAR